MKDRTPSLFHYFAAGKAAGLETFIARARSAKQYPSALKYYKEKGLIPQDKF